MKRQFILCLIIISISLFIGGIAITGVSSVDSEKNLMEHTKTKIESLSSYFQEISFDESNIAKQYVTLSNNNVEIIKMMLQKQIVNGVYTGKMLFNDGMVIRYVNGVIHYPKHEGVDIPIITEENLSTNDGWDTATIEHDGYSEDYLINTIKLNDEYYYVDWTELSSWYEMYSSSSNVSQLLRYVEAAFDCRMIVMDDDRLVLYWSEDVFIEDGDLLVDVENFKDHKTITRNGRTYVTDYIDLADSNWTVYLLIEVTRSIQDSINWLFVYIIVVLLFCAAMITWNFSLKKMVADHILTDEQITRYDPDRVKVYNYTAVLLTTIGVFCFALLISGMLTLRKDVNRGRLLLSSIQDGLSRDIAQMEASNGQKKRWYTYYGENMAEIIDDSGQIPDQETLAKISDLINAQYIILYDENGKEIIASNNYTGLELGTSEDDPTSDFRRLLHGVDSIIHDPVYDKFSGYNSLKIGVRYTVPGTDSYGAMIFALYPDLLSLDYEDFISYRIRGLTSPEDILFMADDENGEIVNSSSPEHIGANLTDYKLSLEDRIDSGVKVKKILGQKYYQQTAPDNNIASTYYYLAHNNFDFGSAFSISLIFTILFLIPLLLCMFISWRGYTREFYEANVLNGDKPITDNFIKVLLSDGRNKRSTDVSLRFSFLPSFWRNTLPENKALTVFNVLLGVIFFIGFYLYSNGHDYENLLLINFLLRSDWQRGVNLFAIFSIILLLIYVSIGMSFVRYIFLIISLPLDTKRETIVRLAFNILQYVVLIAVLYFSFGYLGFDTRSILASVGFVTLALSIGSRDLVADILAGLTIVFEGEYQVGDMIEINGYRGQVQEIGVRSTKLIGRGNNVKIISNRDISNVINLTRNNSWLPLEIKVPATASLDEIEAILEEELPKIGKKNSKIISGPYYYGILSFDKGCAVLSIMTECREQDYNSLSRYLNKELYDLFKRKSIPLG